MLKKLMKKPERKNMPSMISYSKYKDSFTQPMRKSDVSNKKSIF